MGLLNFLGLRSSAATTAATTAAAVTRPGEARADADGIPTALKAAAEKQKQAYTNADGTTRTVRYDGRDMPFGSTTRARLPEGSFAEVLRKMKGSRDAGNAVVVADNATLHTLTYCYGTHKSMEAWLTKTPPDGKLKMNMVLTPSTHAGGSAEDKKKNYENFCKTNVYNLELIFPDGSRQQVKFDVKGNSPPVHGNSNPATTGETATASPEFEIDLAKWAGKDIRIRGWADGSAGVEGYIEHRETILHL
jgi:YD repeat-containing protein